jgi:hypothetical protein
MKSESCYDRRSVGQSVCLGVRPPSGAPRLDFYYRRTVAGLLMWGAFSDGRSGLSSTIADGLRQQSRFRVLVPRDSLPYFTVSESRLRQRGGPGTPGTGWPS